MALSRHVHLVGPAGQRKARGIFQKPSAVAPSNPEASDRNRLRRQNRLPLLLAGPVVRRLERGRVWLWLATSIPVTVYAWVENPSDPLMLRQEIGSGTANSFRLGGRLHITLVSVRATATPPERRGRFPTETILTYNIRLTPAQDDRFFDGEVLLHPNDVSLGAYELPTFFVPASDRSHVRFLHASCRKLHGRGHDAIPQALRALQTTISQPQNRPTHLLLTGDQIYADDVHGELIEQIRWLSLYLMARRENLPALPRSTVLMQAGERGPIVTRGGFTAGEVARHHLLGLGEYAAMYLLAWSPDIWQRFGASSGLEDTSADMCKLLANIPTYMVFDDHEITDDWNLTYEWVFNVGSNPTTRRVVSNGLAAFAAFQGIGNDPRRANTLRRMVTSNPVMATRADTDPVQGVDLNKWPRFDLDTWGFLHWAFVAEMRPRVICLDTRTHRVWERGWAPNRQRVAGLLAPYALRRLRRHLRAVGGSMAEPVVIVSPAPVIGYALEEFQHSSANVDRVTQPLDPDADPEAWSFHRRSFVDFLNTLVDSGRRRFVFLSGDVHYGFAAIAQYTRRQGRSLQRIDMVQFTSSALHNEPSGGQSFGLRQILDRLVNDTGDIQLRLGWEGDDRTSHPAIADSEDSFIARAMRSRPWDFELRWRYVRGVGSSHTMITDNNVGMIEMDLGASSRTIVQSLFCHDSTHETRVNWQRISADLGRP